MYKRGARRFFQNSFSAGGAEAQLFTLASELTNSFFSVLRDDLSRFALNNKTTLIGSFFCFFFFFCTRNGFVFVICFCKRGEGGFILLTTK